MDINKQEIKNTILVEGKWIRMEANSFWWHECSECGGPWDSKSLGWLPAYCPNCGIKMGGDNE